MSPQPLGLLLLSKGIVAFVSQTCDSERMKGWEGVERRFFMDQAATRTAKGQLEFVDRLCLVATECVEEARTRCTDLIIDHTQVKCPCCPYGQACEGMAAYAQHVFQTTVANAQLIVGTNDVTKCLEILIRAKYPTTKEQLKHFYETPSF